MAMVLPAPSYRPLFHSMGGGGKRLYHFFWKNQKHNNRDEEKQARVGAAQARIGLYIYLTLLLLQKNLEMA